MGRAASSAPPRLAAPLLLLVALPGASALLAEVGAANEGHSGKFDFLEMEIMKTLKKYQDLHTEDDTERPMLEALADMPTKHERLQYSKPLAWVHVPKAGSSFANMLIDLPNMCPGIPTNVVINKSVFGENQLGMFRMRYDPLKKGCPSAFSKWGAHEGLGQRDRFRKQYARHAVAFLRSPEQRIVSGWHHGKHDWFSKTPPKDPLQYANRVAGCGVKMMTRTGGEEVCSGAAVKPTEVGLARDRLNKGFIFVGITEHWELSICLAHAMFGGKCRGSDFSDSRLGEIRQSKRAKYDLESLGLQNFTDTADGELYSEGEKFFAHALQLFNVTTESCVKCMDQASRHWI